MALENANFIPELVETNPDGSDPVSQGDDHLRTTKRAVKGSFPAFVGSTATPKAVNKTEDQLNDCAEKAADETVAGLWDFTQLPTFAGGAVFQTSRPKEENFSGNRSLAQADEGKVLRYTGTGGDTVTVDALAADTVLTIKNAGTGNISIDEGTATINWMDGSGSPNGGNRTLAANSVIEVHADSASSVDIWGNGLS